MCVKICSKGNSPQTREEVPNKHRSVYFTDSQRNDAYKAMNYSLYQNSQKVITILLRLPYTDSAEKYLLIAKFLLPNYLDSVSRKEGEWLTSLQSVFRGRAAGRLSPGVARQGRPWRSSWRHLRPGPCRPLPRRLRRLQTRVGRHQCRRRPLRHAEQVRVIPLLVRVDDDDIGLLGAGRQQGTLLQPAGHVHSGRHAGRQRRRPGHRGPRRPRPGHHTAQRGAGSHHRRHRRPTHLPR